MPRKPAMPPDILWSWIWRQRPSRGTRLISGMVCSSKTSSCICLVYTRKHRPGRTLPARPLRCFALARDTHRSRRSCMRVFGSYPFSLHLPLSTTYTTSSTVMEVSAMFVAMTILRTPPGGCSKIVLCSAVLRVLCRPMRYLPPPVAARTVGFVPRHSCSLEISAMPGMNTKIAPGSMDAHTCSTSFVTRS